MAIIELTTFLLADGVDEAAFLTADERVQCEVFNLATGALRRTLAQGDAGRWLVSTVSHQPIDIAAHPAGVAFLALLDPSSIQVERYIPR